MYIIGDTAHASSLHHGARAALCIEDAAVLAALFSNERVRVGVDIEAAFSAFNRSRQE
jgi:salicylate hydroxylase